MMFSFSLRFYLFVDLDIFLITSFGILAPSLVFQRLSYDSINGYRLLMFPFLLNCHPLEGHI